MSSSNVRKLTEAPTRGASDKRRDLSTLHRGSFVSFGFGSQVESLDCKFVCAV